MAKFANEKKTLSPYCGSRMLNCNLLSDLPMKENVKKKIVV